MTVSTIQCNNAFNPNFSMSQKQMVTLVPKFIAFRVSSILMLSKLGRRQEWLKMPGGPHNTMDSNAYIIGHAQTILQVFNTATQQLF